MKSPRTTGSWTAAETSSLRQCLQRPFMNPIDALVEPRLRVCNVANGKPMGIAGFWTDCTLPSGEKIHIFTKLTFKADDNALMWNFHKAEDKMRIFALLHEDLYDAWL